MEDKHQWPLYEVFIRARGGLDRLYGGGNPRRAAGHAQAGNDVVTRKLISEVEVDGAGEDAAGGVLYDVEQQVCDARVAARGSHRRAEQGSLRGLGR